MVFIPNIYCYGPDDSKEFGMPPPPEIRQNSAQHMAGLLDRDATLSASSPDAHVPPSPPICPPVSGASLSTQVVTTITRNEAQPSREKMISNALSAATPLQKPAAYQSISLETVHSPKIVQPSLQTQSQAISPGPTYSADKQRLFEQRQKLVLAIGKSLESERKSASASHKHGGDQVLREGVITRLLQALGLLGDVRTQQGPQTILDRLVSFLAASLKRLDVALFSRKSGLPKTSVQKATTIEERELFEQGGHAPDARIPLTEKSGPTTGRS